MENLAHITYKGIRLYKEINNKKRTKIANNYLVNYSIFKGNLNWNYF